MDTVVFWEAVQRHDREFDNVFVYAVRTTNIYCRPSCPSRRPYRENVEFFVAPSEAEQAGYRACQRCQPAGPAAADPQRDLMIEVCRFLEEAHDKTPSLNDLATRFALSSYHLQRTFKRLIGVSPRQYADAQRQSRLKNELKQTDTVTDALYEAGYGTMSSFYDQTDTILGMKPVTYRDRGKAMNIIYTVAPCRLGYLLVAASDQGISKISLGSTPDALIKELEQEFSQARLTQDDRGMQSSVAVLLKYLEGDETRLDLPLDIQATAFQRKVWEALRTIPYGSTRSYRQVAESIGQPTAARAVAQACANNPVALVIPCHRVVRAGGDLSGYRWGVERKRSLLTQEATTARPELTAVAL